MSTGSPGHARATLQQLRDAERNGYAVDDDRKRELAAKAWDPDAEPRACAGCGAHVDPDTVRVFGNTDGTLHGCQQCLTRSALNHGAGADPDRATQFRESTTNARLNQDRRSTECER